MAKLEDVVYARHTCRVDVHADLYVLVTSAVQDVIDRYKPTALVERFIDSCDGHTWLLADFSYDYFTSARVLSPSSSFAGHPAALTYDVEQAAKDVGVNVRKYARLIIREIFR